VQDYGAVGDGLHDDTDAFARALDALPPQGGTLAVPAGVYLINPLRSIVLRDGVTLALEDGTVLKAIPVVASESQVILASGARNIRIAGGSIAGERVGHLGAGGEWGMGIRLYGCDGAVIEDVCIHDCWGDGICVGSIDTTRPTESRNLVIRRCRSVNNRRQGLSITGCIGAVIEDCEFSGTNGTPPQSGIDLEPDDSAVVRDVRITRCRAVRNAGDGMMLVGRNVTDVTLERNELSQNGLNGLFVRDASRFVIADNMIGLNGWNGIWLQTARQAEVSANVIGSNSCADPGAYDNASVDVGSSDNVLTDNNFMRTFPGHTNVSRFDIYVASQECAGNRLHGNLVRESRANAGGIVDNGSRTEITSPSADAVKRPKRLRPTPARWRSGQRLVSR
jgi:polygalacturonase